MEYFETTSVSPVFFWRSGGVFNFVEVRFRRGERVLLGNYNGAVRKRSLTFQLGASCFLFKVYDRI